MSEIELAYPGIEPMARLAAPIINSHFDITNVYNLHGTEEHALQSAAVIAADSIVFIEGNYASYEPISELDVSRHITRAGAQRLVFGKEYPVYTKTKEILLQVLDEYIDEVPEVDPEFEGHGLRLQRELLAKDCFVMVADANLSHVPEDSRSPDTPQMFARVREHLGMTDEIFAKDAPPISKFKESLRAYGEYTTMQRAREQASISIVTEKLRQIALAGCVSQDMATTELHKIRAYTVWGTSHAASMTGEYLRLGVDVRQKVIRDAPEPLRLIPGHTENPRLLMRKQILSDAAAVAIEATGYQFDPLIEGSGLFDDITVANGETAIRAYIHLDRLHRSIRSGMIENVIATQWAAPRPELKNEIEINTVNLWNALKGIGIAPQQHLAHPILGDLRATLK